MPSTVQILGFAGSLSKQSYNRAILRVAQELVPDGAHLEIITLDDMPLYNRDYENDEPEVVRNFKDKIRKADGLLIAAPEYNIRSRECLNNPLIWTYEPKGTL